MLNWTILDRATYDAATFALLGCAEGIRNKPYLDEKHLVTIGVGFLIQTAGDAYQAPVFSALGITAPADQAAFQGLFQQAANQGDQALQRACDQEMTRQGRCGPFALDTTQIQSLLCGGLSRYEAEVDRWLPGIPLCRERVALLSLAYNGVLVHCPSLHQALVNGDRARAWYEIACNTNSGADHGVAIRRATEGALIDVYAIPTAPTDDERQAAAQVTATFQGPITACAQRFPKAIGEANANYATVRPFLPRQAIVPYAETLSPAA